MLHFRWLIKNRLWLKNRSHSFTRHKESWRSFPDFKLSWTTKRRRTRESSLGWTNSSNCSKSITSATDGLTTNGLITVANCVAILITTTDDASSNDVIANDATTYDVTAYDAKANDASTNDVATNGLWNASTNDATSNDDATTSNDDATSNDVATNDDATSNDGRRHGCLQ